MANKKKLTLLGYKVGATEMALACNHPDGVVLSVGEQRVTMTRAEFLCLHDIFDQFLQSETEL